MRNGNNNPSAYSPHPNIWHHTNARKRLGSIPYFFYDIFQKYKITMHNNTHIHTQKWLQPVTLQEMQNWNTITKEMMRKSTKKSHPTNRFMWSIATPNLPPAMWSIAFIAALHSYGFGWNGRQIRRINVKVKKNCSNSSSRNNKPNSGIQFRNTFLIILYVFFSSFSPPFRHL